MTPEQAREKAQDIVLEYLKKLNKADGFNKDFDVVEAIADALMEAAGEWRTMGNAPKKDRWVLLYDARLKRCVVAQHMTALEDGSQDWVFARHLGSDGSGVAFVSKDATHYRELPAPPEPADG